MDGAAFVRAVGGGVEVTVHFQTYDPGSVASFVIGYLDVEAKQWFLDVTRGGARHRMFTSDSDSAFALMQTYMEEWSRPTPSRTPRKQDWSPRAI